MIGKHVLWALVAGGIVLAAGELLAEDVKPAQVKPAQGAAPAPYRQSFGDLMTMAIQPRHVKLGLAGQQRNWAYAAYELSELQGAFRRIAEAVPVYHATDMTALIEATTAAPIDDVATAIKSADAAKFTEAYAALTATCNACHQSVGHAAVVIQVPRASSFPDQDFSPQRP